MKRTIEYALRRGPTRNYVTPREADSIVRAAAGSKKGIRAVVDLLSRSAVGYGDVDLPGRAHRTPVLSQGAAVKLELAVWHEGHYNAFDFAEIHAEAIERGDWASTRKAAPARIRKLAVEHAMKNYYTRGGDLADISAAELPASARTRYRSLGGHGVHRDVFRFAAGGTVVYGIGVASASKNWVWLFDADGRRIATCNPPSDGEL